MKNTFLISLFLILSAAPGIAQTDTVTGDTDSSTVDKLRTESGVDPTRVNSRIGYTFLIQDPKGETGQVTNRVGVNFGVNRWSLQMKYELVNKTTGVPGSGFETEFGDVKFSVLNAFFVGGDHAFAANAEFAIPIGKAGFGSQYFSITPSVTYSYTINPSFIFAIQPQYTFDLMKDPVYPDLSVLTVRSFLAKFLATGYFFVLEPRPIYDFTSENFDLIISPIIGKALGADSI